METSHNQAIHEDFLPPGMGLRSLSGHPLREGPLVKIAYLDEAGKSNPSQEPYLVIAAVIVDGDKDTGPVVKELENLAREYELHGITCFHAKDIWHGNGTFDRDDPKWPLIRRMELFSKLAGIPQKLNLPIAIGHVQRQMFKLSYDENIEKFSRILGRTLENKASARFAAEHAAAFVKAAKCVDTWMRKNASAERAMLIAENVSDIKRDLKIVHLVSQARDSDISLVGVETFKTEHIVDTLFFAEKRESPFLQMADVCAFIAKSKLMKKPHIDPHYKLIEPQIIRLKRDGEPFRVSYWDGGE